MSLEEYKKKRKFDKTTEPIGTEKKEGNDQRIFVIQEHDASNLHWDLRIEKEGVLKSWAVPKGVPEKEGIKRLAIPTEDHPYEYASFEGEIPEGEYGAGVVEIWDKGTIDILKWSDKEIKVNFKGNKINGIYVMIKTKRGYLLFKKKS
ncbi:MAG: 3'-phosphoesterase [Candidatus Lokiarchaeota archaeon]|nr:3'-phosphoesterase [Candidatus Lokiarchaeota archaeon]